MNRFLSARTLAALICIIIFGVGLWGTFSESAQLALIPRDFSPLTDIGRVQLTEGRIIQKPINDVLWFPLKENTNVFLGDSIETFDDSSVSIEFTRLAKGQIKIGSNTFVQMKSTRNKPLILLYHGELEVSGNEADQIFVSTGVKVENINLKKNRTTKMRRTENGDLEVEVQKMNLAGENENTKPGHDKEKYANESTKKVQTKEVEAEKSYRNPVSYPYPANQTTFLKRKNGQVTIFPAEACSSQCTLKVIKNGSESLPSRSYQQTDRIIYVVDFDESTNGSYSWTFQDGSLILTGIFHIRPNSSEEMKKAVTSGYPIEIMSGL